MNRTAVTDRLAFVLFILGLLGCSFAYGVVVGVYQFFPYGVLRDAKGAVDALQEKYTIPLEPFTEVVDHDKSGVTVHDPARAFDGYTFLMAERDGEYKAVLIDMAGTTLHEWHIEFSEVWSEAPHLIDQAENDHVYWHGAHLFPNGDLLFSFGGGFPYGAGLVKLDKNSNVLWALPRNTHHDLHVEDDGTAYVVAHNFKPEGLPGLADLQPPYYEDVILKISPEGEILNEISVLGAVYNSEYRGLLSLTYRENISITSQDPLHLNTIELLSNKLAGRFPLFESGDILLSFRNINTIAILDPESKKIKWALTGKFVRQHDPDFLKNGNILLFDNKGGEESNGGSQILEIDPIMQHIVWRYTGNAETPFFSAERGSQQPLPNGNVLIAESDGGRILEVTREDSPRIVWEYVNRVQSKDGENRVGWVSLALRVQPEALTFLK